MSIVENLFSSFDNLNKKTNITNSSATYGNNVFITDKNMPALNQGNKFNNYQKKIKNNTVSKISKVSKVKSIEGFDNNDIDSTNLTNKSNQVLQNTNMSSQEQNIVDLTNQYNATLEKYETLLEEISGTTTNYFNRVNPNNPYLGNNIQIGTEILYVTNQGVAKWYPNQTIFTSTAGQNGCPAQQTVITVNVPWSNNYKIPGTPIPTTPPLITGTPMTSGQSCGNEGSNVLVDEMLINPTPTYVGCYKDNTTSPTMKFIGGAPSQPAANLQNGNFSQPQIANNSYQYISSNTQVSGWDFYAVLINNSSAWNYPMPYPAGSQAACIQGTQIFGQWINFSSGAYTVSFYACGRPGFSGSNTINIYCGQTGNPQQMPTVYTFTPPVNSWQKYTTTLNISTSGNYAFGFYGTINNINNSSAIQNIQITSSGSSGSGTYSYSTCEQAAINSGYQYFALQNVNPQTALGYCGVSNDEPSVTNNGTSYVPSGQFALWSSNTQGQTGNTASLTISGSLSVLNSSGTSVFSTPNTNAQPSNYIGCYGDNPNRAMFFYNNGAQQYNLQQCQQIAQQTGNQYFGLQNSSSGQTAQCAIGNNISQAQIYGKAGNCTQISDGSWSGGGWSNALYSMSPQSIYFLILQDDGNMCVYRGSGPNDNQGYIWCSGTNGKIQQPNPAYAAANGKYGKNWIASGSTLAAGDFVGSTNGGLALIMQTDGNLVLYTFTNSLNCQKMSDGNIGGGVGANALYNIGKVGIPGNINKTAFIDQDAELHAYPVGQPINPPIGVSSNTTSIDSVTYQNYVNGGPLPTNYGLSNATYEEKRKLSKIQTELNGLSSQIINLTGTLGDNTKTIVKQMTNNENALGDYVTSLSDTRDNINNFDTNYDNILHDTEIVTLQKNYEYLFWSILATGTVLLSMNYLKK